MHLAEVDRRQNHINQVDPNHPLLPIALNCLKDEPGILSIPQLSSSVKEYIANLKERPEYSESVTAARQEN